MINTNNYYAKVTDRGTCTWSVLNATLTSIFINRLNCNKSKRAMDL